jgi:hypothetical protein
MQAVRRGAKGLLLAGERPEAALAALGASGGPPQAVAIVAACLAGRTPAFGRSLARLELSPAEIAQAGFEVLAGLERAAREGEAAPPGDAPRAVRPRFIEGETLPR